MSVRSRMSGFAGGARLPGTAVVRAMHLRLRSGFRSGLSGLDADTTNSSWPFRCHRRAQEAAHRRLLRLLHILGVCLALTGCAGTSIMPGASGSVFGSTPERANLTPAQACAIGYDMARHIYERARVSETVIRVSPDLGPCGKYAARYLRLAGFAVDETATRRDAYVFTIRTYEDPEMNRVIATAALPGLHLTRAYRRAGFGVTAASAFTIVTSHPGSSDTSRDVTPEDRS